MVVRMNTQKMETLKNKGQHHLGEEINIAEMLVHGKGSSSKKQKVCGHHMSPNVKPIPARTTGPDKVLKVLLFKNSREYDKVLKNLLLFKIKSCKMCS
jgi:hypothetical protein